MKIHFYHIKTDQLTISETYPTMYFSVQQPFCDLITVRRKRIENRKSWVGLEGQRKKKGLCWIVRTPLVGYNFKTVISFRNV